MQETISNKYRPPNDVELFIIERCIRNTRHFYIEVFMLSMAIVLSLCYLAFVGVADGDWILGICLVMFVMVLGLLLVIIWSVIKSLSQTKDYQIFSAKGKWRLVSAGTGKTKHFVSEVNGMRITMVIPGLAILPKYGEEKEIKYEYVKILECPPPFGYDNMFMSIDGKTLNEQHKQYINQVKPIRISYILLSIVFLLNITFCFYTAFNVLWMNITCLCLFLVFLKTIAVVIQNKGLRRNMESGD